MASLQCLDSIGFPLLLKPHLVGGLYATLAAVATPQPVKFTLKANVPLGAFWRGPAQKVNFTRPSFVG